ncbi:MAG: uracil-DNA glycosylase [Candidatus Krumholzibacteriota bacterium]|nr:uracil-DNA glycosylase [Candidatus Krumholzibacteriota bacterium]
MNNSAENTNVSLKKYLKRLLLNDHVVLHNFEDCCGSPEEKIMVKTSPAGEEEKEMVSGGSDLDSLEKAVTGCRRCELYRTRNNTVFGAGNRAASIVFIGEAPGRDEDLQGIPFVGRAGKLLDKILEAIGFSRDDIYIANILKCRPPGNRDPKEEEVEACERYLAAQLKSIDPVLICALGRVAAQNLLKTKASLKVLRESEHYYNGIRVVATYHPAALLRNPAYKRPTWEDMKLLRRLHDEALETR